MAAGEAEQILRGGGELGTRPRKARQAVARRRRVSVDGLEWPVVAAALTRARPSRRADKGGPCFCLLDLDFASDRAPGTTLQHLHDQCGFRRANLSVLVRCDTRSRG